MAPSTPSILHLDADTAFSQQAFDRIGNDGNETSTTTTMGPEIYFHLSPQASLIGTQNQQGRMLINSGTTLLKNTRWAMDFLALWWYGRCDHKAQLSLWNVFYETWSAWTMNVPSGSNDDEDEDEQEPTTTLATNHTESNNIVAQWAYLYHLTMMKLFMNFRKYGRKIQTSWEVAEKEKRTAKSRRGTPSVDDAYDDTYDYPSHTNTTLYNGGDQTLQPVLEWQWSCHTF
jgi:hypothetical protein